MECTLMVGDKVVCVDAIPRNLPRTNLVKGEIYTITRVRLYYGTPTVLLREVSPAFEDAGFYADRFRRVLPAADKQVEALKALLMPGKMKETV